MKKKLILLIFCSILISLLFLNQASAASELGMAGLLENRGISFSMVAIAGLLDGLNPCALGIVVMLLGYILIFAHQPDKMMKNGVAYQYIGKDGNFYGVSVGGHHQKLAKSLDHVPIRNNPNR